MLDTIIAATENNVAGENHNLSDIAVDVDGAIESRKRGIQSQIDGRQDGGWDAGEMGISVAELERRLELCDTPEARAQLMQEIILAAQQRANLFVRDDGKVAVMVSGDKAWHELGYTMRRDFTADEIKELCLNWEYEIRPARDERGEVIPKLRYIELVNPDGTRKTLEGVGVGNRHTVCQPATFIDWAASIVGSIEGANFCAAGAVDDGKRIWTQAKLPEVLEPIRGDVTELYLLATDVFDGSSVQEVITTADRAVCDNTLRLARSRGTGCFRNRHTANMETRMDDFRDQTRQLSKRWRELSESAPAMVSTRTDVREFAKPILDDVLGVTEAMADKGKALELALGQTEIDQANKIFDRRARQSGKALETILDIAESETNTARGSVWGAFQTTTQYANHNLKYRGGTTDAKAFDSLLRGGRADEINQQALESALELTR